MEAHVNAITMHYVDQGAGPAVLLVHAFPLTGAMWEPQIVALSGAYRVIAPDLRGFGASTGTPGPSLMETFADDLAALLDHLGIAEVILGGLSMGGYIAFAFLRRYPQRVRALALADTRANADTAEAQAGRETNARLVETEGVGALADKMLPNLLAPDATPDVRAAVRAIVLRNQPQGVAAALRGMALRPDSTELLPQITVPTLILVGSEDSLTPPAVAHAMQQAIPNSRLVEIPAAGHITNLEQPDAFNAALLAFLRDLM